MAIGSYYLEAPRRGPCTISSPASVAVHLAYDWRYNLSNGNLAEESSVNTDGSHHPDADGQVTGRVPPDDIALNPVRLAVFRRVVECRSFTRAADELALTQSTVSGHIRVLEDVFGSPLFDRQRRGAQLTEVGRAVYDFAISMQRELGALRDHISDLTGGHTGVVTLGTPIVPNTNVLPELLARFLRMRPGAQLRMRLLRPEAICEEVAHGQLDLGIVSELCALPPSVRAEPLWLDAPVVVALPEHRLAARPRVTLTDLVDEPFVVAWGRTLGDQVIDRALARIGLPPRRIVMEAGNHYGVLEAARQGVGLGVLFYRVAAPDVASGKLVVLPLEELPASEQFLLIRRLTRRVSPLVEQLTDFLREESAGLSESMVQFSRLSVERRRPKRRRTRLTTTERTYAT